MFVLDAANEFLNRDPEIYLGPLNDKSEPLEKYSYLGILLII